MARKDEAAASPAFAAHLRVLERLASERPGKKLLSEALDVLAGEIGGERISLFRLRPGGGFRILAARSLDHEDLSRPEEKVSHHAVKRMVESGRAFFAADASRDRRYRTEESLHGKRMALSILVLPLRVRGEVRAGIYVDHRFHALRRPAEGDLAVESLLAVLALALSLLEGPVEVRRPAGARRRGESVDPSADRSPDANGALVASRADPDLAGEAELFHGILSANPDLRDVFDAARGLARSDLPVVIHGETGTGKGLLARAIHEASSRRDEAFVTFHCSSVPENLVESELMGHVRGAFTGAHADHDGVFVLADGGTIFLDEVGDMTPELQKKLLRVLEDGRVRPLGGKDPLQVDVRLVSATSRDLERLVREGRFRRDLFFRIKGAVLHLPPLRDRREDVLRLALHFLEVFARKEDRRPPRLTEAARHKLVAYPWPGNVREVENEMRRLVALGCDPIEPGHLSLAARPMGPRVETATGRGGNPGQTLEEAVALAEREALETALREAKGNKSRAAESLGITRKSLYRRMSKYGLDRDGR